MKYLLLAGGLLLLLATTTGCQSQLARDLETTKAFVDYLRTSDVEADVIVHLPTYGEAYLKEGVGFGSPGGYLEGRLRVRRPADLLDLPELPFLPNDRSED